MYFRTFVQTYISTNVFVKPNEQSQACLSFAMARKRAMKWNLFVKPDEQSQACLSFAMTRKGAMKWNVFLER